MCQFYTTGAHYLHQRTQKHEAKLNHDERNIILSFLHTFCHLWIWSHVGTRRVLHLLLHCQRSRYLLPECECRHHYFSLFVPYLVNNSFCMFDRICRHKLNKMLEIFYHYLLWFACFRAGLWRIGLCVLVHPELRVPSIDKSIICNELVLYSGCCVHLFDIYYSLSCAGPLADLLLQFKAATTKLRSR